MLVACISPVGVANAEEIDDSPSIIAAEIEVSQVIEITNENLLVNENFTGMGRKFTSNVYLQKGVVILWIVYLDNNDRYGATNFILDLVPQNLDQYSINLTNDIASSKTHLKKLTIEEAGYYYFDIEHAASSCAWGIHCVQYPPEAPPSAAPLVVNETFTEIGERSTNSFYLWPGFCDFSITYSNNRDSYGATNFIATLNSESPGVLWELLANDIAASDSFTKRVKIQEAGWYYLDVEKVSFSCNWTISVNQAKQKVDISNASASATNMTWTGKLLKPNGTVTYSGMTLQPGGHYKVSHSNNKNIGTATITFTGIGDFTGTTSTTFKIIPKKMAKPKVAVGEKQMTIGWKAYAKSHPKATKYQVRCREVGKAWKTKTVSNKSTKTTVMNLNKGKKYQIQVRSYRAAGGDKYYSVWSTTRTSAKIK